MWDQLRARLLQESVHWLSEAAGLSPAVFPVVAGLVAAVVDSPAASSSAASTPGAGHKGAASSDLVQ